MHVPIIAMAAWRGGFLILLALSLDANSENRDNQTIIEEEAPEKSDTQFDYVKDKAADQTASDASVLYQIPGVTLTETGGPLGISSIRFHGLSDARLQFDVEGLAMSNPINGLLDANSLFLFAGERLIAEPQSLSLKLPHIAKPVAKGIFGIGSLDTLKLNMSAGSPIGSYSSIFTAMQFAGTNGSFSYGAPEATNAKGHQFLRQNNDQHRLSALVNYEHSAPTNKAHALLAINAHEGGISGLALSPTKHLRTKAIFLGLKAGCAQKLKRAEFSVDISNSLFDYRTTDEAEPSERISATTHEITFGMKPNDLASWLDLDLKQRIVIEHAYQLHKTRIGGGFLLNRISRFKGKLKPRLEATMSFIGYQHHGIIRNKDVALTIEPLEFLSLTGRFKYTNRLPTFLEMYANNRFFVGNRSLENESIWDLEFASNIKWRDHTRLFLAGFMGFIGDTIVYAFNATRIKPINSGVAKRHGIDIALSTEPLSWLMFETKNSIIYSKVSGTSAALPQTPGFLGLTSLRFGNDDFLALTLQSRYRGQATANMCGTLRTEPYVLFDALFSARLNELLRWSLSITNIFNVKTAQDTYEVPLPGTIIYSQIEVGSV